MPGAPESPRACRIVGDEQDEPAAARASSAVRPSSVGARRAVRNASPSKGEAPRTASRQLPQPESARARTAPTSGASQADASIPAPRGSTGQLCPAGGVRRACRHGGDQPRSCVRPTAQAPGGACVTIDIRTTEGPEHAHGTPHRCLNAKSMNEPGFGRQLGCEMNGWSDGGKRRADGQRSLTPRGRPIRPGSDPRALQPRLIPLVPGAGGSWRWGQPRWRRRSRGR